MRIADYELFSVPPRWLFLRVETADGSVGWGEPILEGRTRTVAAAVAELMDEHLLGEDPAPIEDHWQTLYRGGFYRGGPVLMSAIAGIDQALWDLKGKQLGASVHELLGGPVRERMRVYRWIGGDDPADVAGEARSVAAEGYTALKMNATGKLRRIDSPPAVAAAVDRLAAVREAVGPGVDVAVDFHGRASKTMARRLIDALAPHEPMFVEEPVRPEQTAELAAVAEHAAVPVATGERTYSRWDAREVLPHVDAIQPDVSHAGGITEVLKIASMAEAYDVALALHCPLGPVALAACLQVDAVAPNALIQETSVGIHYNADAGVVDYLADQSALTPEDGFVDVPTGPGLGIEVDEGTLRERDGHDDWHNPVWRHDDGSVAEW